MQKSGSAYWSKKIPIKDAVVHPFARKALRFLEDKKSGKNLLDLGCGFGTDSLFFAKNGYKVTAVDFSDMSVRKLKESLRETGVKNVKVLQRDIAKKLPFRSDTFNAVYAHLSLHYFDDDTTEKIFGELHRVLRKGGLVFIKCKSTDDPLYGKGKRMGEHMYLHNHFRHFFTTAYMRGKLRNFQIQNLRKSSGVYDGFGLKSAFIEAVAIKV